MIDETAEEIAAMQTHGSSAVATAAAEALEALLEREFASVEEFERSLERNSHALRRANPSHASLHTTQREILRRVGDGDHVAVPAAKEALREAISAVTDRIERAKSAAAANLAERIEDGHTLLTHDYSTTVISAIERAVAADRSLTVYATEARPRVLGRKTARTLAEYDAVDVHLITDGASGVFLGECDGVVLGMDCIVEDTLYNRVGTYPLCATAADLDVPVMVAGSSAKLIDGGFRFENDFRAASEVIREPAEGFTVENPAYDATPTRLVDYVVTDEGVREP